MTPASMDLRDPAEAKRYYSARYGEGYMQDWPPAKLARVHAYIRSLDLPATGAALDFGCGTGVFTRVLVQALPGWAVSGTDIVESALAKAASRVPEARFMPLDEVSGQYEFVFSHHVLEHVGDLGETLSLVGSRCAAGGLALHILPCGNRGSLEFNLCSARMEGIDCAHGGRFFFEDEGHLRRLTSEQFACALSAAGFEPCQFRFANHYYGALHWMTEQSVEWLKATVNPALAIDSGAQQFLKAWRRRLLAMRYARRPPSLIPGFEWRLSKPNRASWENALLVMANPFTIGSGFVDSWIAKAEQKEWEDRGAEPCGSEMYSLSRRR